MSRYLYHAMFIVEDAATGEQKALDFKGHPSLDRLFGSMRFNAKSMRKAVSANQGGVKRDA